MTSHENQEYSGRQRSFSFTARLTFLLDKQRSSGGGFLCLPWRESTLGAVERARVSLGGVKMMRELREGVKLKSNFGV